MADDVNDHRQAQGCHRHGGRLDNMDIGDGLHGDLLDQDLPCVKPPGQLADGKGRYRGPFQTGTLLQFRCR